MLEVERKLEDLVFRLEGGGGGDDDGDGESGRGEVLQTLRRYLGSAATSTSSSSSSRSAVVGKNGEGPEDPKFQVGGA